MNTFSTLSFFLLKSTKKQPDCPLKSLFPRSVICTLDWPFGSTTLIFIVYTWNLGNIRHCNCKPRSSSPTSVNSSVAPSILNLDWQVLLHSSNTHDSELQYAIFCIFPSLLIQYHQMSWMLPMETILPSAPLRLRFWFAINVRPKNMKIKAWSTDENVYTF